MERPIGSVVFGPENKMPFPKYFPALKRDEQGKPYICPKCVLGWLIIIAIGVAAVYYFRFLRGT